MARSRIPDLILEALAADPSRDRPYTTTELQQAVARLGGRVTRDTIAHWARYLGAGWMTDDTRLVEWHASTVAEHRWRLSGAGWKRHVELNDPKED